VLFRSQVLGGLAILGAALILQLGAGRTGRAVAAPAIEADEPEEPLPAVTTVSARGGSG